MTKQEISEFIEQMEEIGDKWEIKDVERVYGDCSLEEALHDRKGTLGTFFNTIGKVLNS